jgi:hypothetical protein
MFKRHLDEIETIMWVNLNHVNEILLQWMKSNHMVWNDELDVLDDMERYGHINEIYHLVETDWKGETRSFGWSS